MKKMLQRWMRQRRNSIYSKGRTEGFQAAEAIFSKSIDERVTERLSQQIKVINPFDVLKKINGKLCLGGIPIDNVEVKNLKSEVIILKELRIWKIFQETLKQYAIDKTFNDSTNFEEVLGGKMMGHNLGIQKKIVELIEEF